MTDEVPVPDEDPHWDPMIGPKLDTGRHRVRGHDRTLPPREPGAEDPNALHLFDLPDPLPSRPRIIPVRPHRRRNPRRKKETIPMETLTPLPTPPTSVGDLDPALPSGYHGDPPPDPPRLRARMVQALQAFRRQDDPSRTGLLVGMTDEELVASVQDSVRWSSYGNVPKLPSPSGIRTARKDLERAGLVEKAEALRPTALGNQAFVFVLTQAGRDFELPQ